MFDFPVYGLTETGGVSHHDQSPPKIGTVGHLLISSQHSRKGWSTHAFLFTYKHALFKQLVKPQIYCSIVKKIILIIALFHFDDTLVKSVSLYLYIGRVMRQALIVFPLKLQKQVVKLLNLSNLLFKFCFLICTQFKNLMSQLLK